MHRPTLSRALLVSLRHSSSSSSSSQIHPAYPARDRLDPSTVELLDDQTLGTRERRRRRRASDLERRSEDRSAPETLGSPQKVNGDIERDTQDWDAISEGFSQSPQTTAGPSRAFSVSHAENVDVEESEYFAPRDERRSPASVFGSKRIGSVVLPGQLIDGIQKQIDETDPRDLRQAYLTLLPNSNTPAPSATPHKTLRPSRINAQTPTLALAQAATVLPGQYAVLRNVVREIKRRVGREWMGRDGKGKGKGAVVWDGGMGSAIWASLDVNGELAMPESLESPVAASANITGTIFNHVQSSRHMMDITELLFEDVDIGSSKINHTRNPAFNGKPSVVFSTFHLSRLTTKTARMRRIQEFWDSGAEFFIIVDAGTKDGFKAVSEARSQLLELGRRTPLHPVASDTLDKKSRKSRREAKARAENNERDVKMVDELQSDGREKLVIGGEVFYEEGEESIIKKNAREEAKGEEVEMVGSHVIAPCPHDGACPLIPTRDICHFSQRLQTPSFLRRTKHSQRGDEDIKYTYVVVRRGQRPTADFDAVPAGRLGGVGKEALQQAKEKLEGKSGVLMPLGGEEDTFHIMSDPAHHEQMEQLQEVQEAQEREKEMSEQEMEEVLRKEAYTWPRLVYPPLKRSGHVVMDTCHPSGVIVRLTLPRSASKQAYHDARKITWGDLFPHQVKGVEVVRSRGIKKLIPQTDIESLHDEDEEVMEADEDTFDSKDWPTASLVDIEAESNSIENELTGRSKEEDVIVRTFG